jgi:lysophospholipase L1-like esterase
MDKARLRKAVAFRAIALSIPVVLFLIVEGICRLATPGFSEDPYINFTSPVSIFSKVEEGGVEYYQVTHPDAYRARNLRFTTHKKPNTLRIMCLGESASAGWPHPATEVYSEYLRQALEKAFPGKTVEVLNIGVHAYASYRLRMVFDDIIRFEPDLIVTWIGNNEFLEQRTYLQRSGAASVASRLSRSLRVVQLAKIFLAKRMHPENTVTGQRRMFKAYANWTLVKRISKDLRKDPVQFADVKEHYAYTMDYMAREALARNVPMLMLTVPVNLRDWKPNVSGNEATGEALERWRAAYTAGRKALLDGDAAAAVARLREAAKIDPASADTHFYLGRALEAAKDYPAAYAEYMAASDTDENPFRTITPFRETVRSMPARFPNVHVVEAERAVAAAAENGLPGFDMFVDYVHPTKKGNLVIAKAVYDAILEHDFFHVPPATRAFEREDQLYEGKPYDELHDALLQGDVVYMAMTMHQDESTVAEARTIVREHMTDALQIPARVDDKLIEAVSAHLAVEEKEIRGVAVDPAEKAKAEADYQAAYVSMFGKKAMRDEAPRDEQAQHEVSPR